MGNKFLANIRECDAIVHVVRCFDDDDVIHVEGKVDPIDDISVINFELALADMAQIERQGGMVVRSPRDAYSLYFLGFSTEGRQHACVCVFLFFFNWW